MRAATRDRFLRDRQRHRIGEIAMREKLRVGRQRDRARQPDRSDAPKIPHVRYRIGENEAGITNAFSCFTTTPGGFRAGHWPVADAAARTLVRSLASL